LQMFPLQTKDKTKVKEQKIGRLPFTIEVLHGITRAEKSDFLPSPPTTLQLTRRATNS